jgi:hypothetical protein
LAVEVHRCTLLPRCCEHQSIGRTQVWREQTEAEKLVPWAAPPKKRNPDLDTDTP